MVFDKVGSVADIKLYRDLSKYSLKVKDAESSDISTVAVQPFISSTWSGGYDYIFKDLSFRKLYLLQCVVSSGRLIFKDEDNALKLYEILTRINEDLFNEIVSSVISTKIYGYAGTQFLITNCERNLDNRQYCQSVEEEDDGKSEEDWDSDDYWKIRRVLITPLRLCPQIPTLDQTNRVLRRYAKFKDRFLRVSFVDENFATIFQARSPDVINRIRRILQEGFKVAGKHFKFLAYSNSQLREQSCWFYQEPLPDETKSYGIPSSEEIRQSLGDLYSIRLVGKFGARLGQGFSSTVTSLDIEDAQVCEIPDVEAYGHCFSDGVGMISKSLSESVAEAISETINLGSNLPSAYQIRYKGCKGVVSVAPKGVLPPGIDLALRKSMKKFEGSPLHKTLEVVTVSKPIKCYLNRQVILLLSGLGVPDDKFLWLLREMTNEMDRALKDSNVAKEFLRKHGSSPVPLQMFKVGFRVENEPFLHSLVVATRNKLLLDLQVRARIFVPRAVTLIGVLDETGELEYGSIFFQYTDEEGRIRRLDEGTKCAVYRSPSLHPGDIRVLKVRNLKKLRHLVNVAVFPATGKRPHPNEMSGGDLDGDIYSIVFDPELIPTDTYTPMDFSTPSQIGESRDSVIGSLMNLINLSRMGVILSENVTIDKVKDFFVDYLSNDNLGVIANAHVAFADKEEDGVFCHQCIKLAELHSIAVDFGKTGVPAKMTPVLYPEEYPTFMMRTDKPSYESKKVLGIIYGEVTKLSLMQPECTHKSMLDESLILPGHEKYLEDAHLSYNEYARRLNNIMTKFGVYDEGEVMSGFVCKFSRRFSKQVGRGCDATHQLGKEVGELQAEFRDIFWFNIVDHENEDEQHLWENPEAWLKASAWYCATYDCSCEVDTFYSFAWIPGRVLCKIKELAAITKQTLRVSKLEIC
jgi:RNA-dependent RNA polymerase